MVAQKEYFFRHFPVLLTIWSALQETQGNWALEPVQSLQAPLTSWYFWGSMQPSQRMAEVRRTQLAGTL